MNSPEFKNIVCRICLDENVAFDWNNSMIEHSDLTYKDCYYKYTQLKQLDDDPLSSMLCENCSNGLEDAHSLIMKALDSYNFLLEVNCVKINTDDAIVEEGNENWTPTDFEAILVEKPEIDSEILEEFEHESASEASIKSEDSYEMQYQEILEIEKQNEFDETYCAANVKEDTDRKLSILPCKRKFKGKAYTNSKIYTKNSRASYSCYETDKDSMESFDETSMKSDTDNINTEELQYEEILHEHEEYEGNHRIDYKGSDEGVSKGAKAKRKNSDSTSGGSLKKDAKLSKESNLKKSEILRTRHKNDSQNSKLVNEPTDSRTKNSCEPKRRKTKTNKNNHLNSQNTPRMCSYCSKILHNKYALQKHEKTHLANRERKAPCPICGVKFLEESYVKIHMQIHNQNRVKKHKCEFCDKAFYEKGSLNVHRRIHLGQMIPCTLCPKEFFRQVDVDIHMNSHSAAVINAETKKRSRYWVRCKYCNKDIMSTSFKYHTAMHLNEPQMKCSICDREFFRRDSCTDHLKTVHKKATEEYSNFIILYNKNRLSHLYLEQTAELKK